MSGLRMANPSMGAYAVGAGPLLLPAGPAIGAAVDTAVAAHTYGAWTQVSAALDRAIYVTGAHVVRPAIDLLPEYLQMQIGLGAAGQEVAVGTYYGLPIITAEAVTYLFAAFAQPYVAVEAGQRLAVRLAWDVAGDGSMRVTLAYVRREDLRPIT